MEYEKNIKNEKRENYYNLSGIILIIYMLIFNTLHTPFNRVNRYRYLILLFITILFLIINKNKKINISKLDLFWLGFLVWIIIRASLNLNNNSIYTMIVYSCWIFMIVILKRESINYNLIFNIILVLSLFYAIGNFIQYFYPQIYTKYLINLIFPGEIKLTGGTNGFTRQVAHSAGYIINGIGIYFLSVLFTKKKKINNYLTISFLFVALALTYKRAHLGFSLISLGFIYLLKNQGFRKIKKIIKISLILFFVVFSISIYINNVGIDLSNSFDKVFYRYYYTVEKIKEGEDFTNGRTGLSKNALDLFKEKPILGNGWDDFRERYISNVHNIYLELLTDTGIVGLVIFLIPVTWSYIESVILTKKIVKIDNNSKELYVMLYSIYQQTFFILYGFTGQNLQDYNFTAMYFLAILMFSNIKFKLATKKEITSCDK